MDKYEEKYNEALKRAKAAIDIAADKDLVKDVTSTIFPELRESEDEKIRKQLIEFIKWSVDRHFMREDFHQAKRPSEWIAYLEKQKEHHLELKAGKWYICHRAFCCRADHLTVKEGERFQCEKDGIVKGFVIKEPEKYFKECSAPAPMEDEQKSAEWSEEDSDILRDAICATDILAKDFKKDNPHLAKTLMVTKEWLESLPNRFSLPIKQEWDEFDEDCLKRAIWYVENPAPSVVKDTNLALWLKSLPERFNLQSKQEWSEEDEEIAHTILNLLCSQVTYVTGQGTTSGKQFPTYPKERDWFEKRFKSLRPSWKPSEEQMEAFRSYIKDFQEKAEAAVGGWNNFDVMIRLFEQLNKLKGGIAPMKEVDE